MTKTRTIAAATALLMTTMTTLADDIKGVVVDKHSREPLIGATVMVGNKGAVTDTEGRFAIQGLKKGKTGNYEQNYSRSHQGRQRPVLRD